MDVAEPDTAIKETDHFTMDIVESKAEIGNLDVEEFIKGILLKVKNKEILDSVLNCLPQMESC